MASYHEKATFSGTGNRSPAFEITGPAPGPCICSWAWSGRVQHAVPKSKGMYLKSRNMLCPVRHQDHVKFAG